MKRCRSRAAVRWEWLAALTAVLVARPPAAAAQGPPPSPAAESGSPADLTTRFHFLERYSSTEERSRLDAIGPYKVGVRETNKVLIEKPQGAPERDEWTTQAIYTERPARMTGSATVSAVVRRYEAFQQVPDPSARPSRPRPLEGLTIWYQSQPGEAPQVLSLVPDRGLREDEFQIIDRQVFLPELSALLPTLPVRIGDKWRIPRARLAALLGDRPVRGNPLTGTLKEVRKGVKGPIWEATLGVTGRVLLPAGETMVNAVVLFQFPPPSPEAAPASGKESGDGSTVEAPGAILEVRMALSSSAALPGTSDRLKKISTRDVVVGRQLSTQGATLTPPEAPPTPTEANSWLTYEDPLGRFHFRHPQSHRPVPQPDSNSVLLNDPRPSGPDPIDIRLQVGADRQRLDPEFHRKQLEAEWDRNHFEVIRGPAEWLDDPAWEKAKMRVFRIEAALSLGTPTTRTVRRVHADYYLVLLPRESLFVTSMTGQDPPLPFRKQVETLIRTFRLDSLTPTPTPTANGAGRAR
jgi:hypothetical protein